MQQLKYKVSVVIKLDHIISGLVLTIDTNIEKEFENLKIDLTRIGEIGINKNQNQLTLKN